MSSDAIVEDVPRFVRRYGDRVSEGSNNVITIWGTDRAKKGPASLDDGLGHVDAPGNGKGTGTWHTIAGRAGEDPDFEKDEAFVYLSRKTKADTNLGLEGVEEKTDEQPSAIVKSDVVRIVARKNLKIATEKGEEYLYVKSKLAKVRVGNVFISITDKVVTVNVEDKTKIVADSGKIEMTLGSTRITANGQSVEINSPKVSTTGGSADPREKWAQALMDAINNHGHVTAMGPTTPMNTSPQNAATVADLAAKFALFKSQTLG